MLMLLICVFILEILERLLRLFYLTMVLVLIRKSSKTGWGLQNIDSRIQSIHALSKWKSKKDKGSRLIIKTPIQ